MGRFQLMGLSSPPPDNDVEESRKQQRRQAREDLQCYGKDDVCANCFVLEKNAQGGKLFQRGWCHQVTHCSP
jgi:hypothetical protein